MCIAQMLWNVLYTSSILNKVVNVNFNIQSNITIDLTSKVYSTKKLEITIIIFQ